jgi:hypothetical protein
MGQVGTEDDPTGSECNPYTAHFGRGSSAGCPTVNGVQWRAELWCSDFAEEAWQQAGVNVSGITAASSSFYNYGVAHGTWHPLSSGYTPQPGDAAIFGAPASAAHVGIVYSGSNQHPNVVQGDYDVNGIVEVFYQSNATNNGAGANLSGYVSPIGATQPPPPLSSRNLLFHAAFAGPSSSGWAWLSAGSGDVGSDTAYASSDVPGGNAFLEFNTSLPGGSVYQDVSTSVSAGQSFVFSTWVRSATSTPVSVCVVLWGLGNQTNGQSCRTVRHAWQLVSAPYDAPGAANALRAQVYANTPGVNIDLADTELAPQIAILLAVSKAGHGSGTVTSNPGAISCGSECSATLAPDSTVTLTAAPAAGSSFSGWSGACSGTGECTLTMSSSASVTATFSKMAVAKRTLTVTRSGSGTGSVASSPTGISCGSTCSHSYSSGTRVTLKATAASGSTFEGWSGACTGTATCALTMSAAHSVQASFLKDCVVPNLKGKTLRAAKQALTTHGCSLGQIKRVHSTRVKKGHVITQKPRPHEQLSPNAKINLTVSKGKR